MIRVKEKLRCNWMSPLLWDYARDRLPASRSHRVHEHLQGCPSCFRKVETFRQTAAGLEDYRRCCLPEYVQNWHAVHQRLEEQISCPAGTTRHENRLREALFSFLSVSSASPRLRDSSVFSDQTQRTAAPVRSWAAAAVVILILIGLATKLGMHRTGSHQTDADRPRISRNDAPAPTRKTDGLDQHRPPAPFHPSPDQRIVGPMQANERFLMPVQGGPRDGHAGVPAPVPSDRAYAPGTMEKGAVDDLAEVNDATSTALLNWSGPTPGTLADMQRRIDTTIHTGDDFVAVPWPMLASADTTPQQRRALLTAAAAEYRRQKEIVDARLSRNVTLAIKNLSLADLCRQLTDKMGIDLKADRSVADEKVTLFCDERPLREIMRQINHLFGFSWQRSGEEGAYRYELQQDLRGRLLEEELRNQDLHEAMLELDKALRERLRNEPKDRDTMWAGLTAYGLLSSADCAALANGDHLELSMNSANPDRRLPPDMRLPLLRASELAAGTFEGRRVVVPLRAFSPGVQGTIPLTDVPDAMPTVGLHIDRSEAGELSLMVDAGAWVPSPDGGTPGISMMPLDPVARASSPSIAHPENAKRQEALRNDPLFKRTVSLKPVSSCPHYAPNAPARSPAGAGDENSMEAQMIAQEGPHVFSGDVWEAVHRETGLPIIADSYSRYYLLSKVTATNVPLFEALCKVADETGAHWKKDDDFLQCRSTRFIWDKIKEVPNRSLERWRKDREQNGGLPLEDLLEMAALSDAQLGSTTVGKVIEHCGNLPEWGIVGSGHVRLGPLLPADMIRPFLRVVASLPASQRRQAMQPAGLPVDALRPAQQDALVAAARASKFVPQEALPPGARFSFAYVPVGVYTWNMAVKRELLNEAQKWPLISAKTYDEALAAARRLYPAADPRNIIRSKGVFCFSFLYPDGSVYGIGKPLTYSE